MFAKLEIFKKSGAEKYYIQATKEVKKGLKVSMVDYKLQKCLGDPGFSVFDDNVIYYNTLEEVKAKYLELQEANKPDVKIEIL